MKVRPVHCGPFANRSETDAFRSVKAGLASLRGDGEWVLLTNLTISIDHQLQSDEIDMVAVGPPGVRVIEVKHWANRHWPLAETEADRVAMKARQVGAVLRGQIPATSQVEQVVLLTQPANEITKFIRRDPIRDVRFYSLKNWRKAVNANGPQIFDAEQVARIARLLALERGVSDEGTLRRLAGYVNLERLDTRRDGFHRVFRGMHSVSRDRAILHLFDMSAGSAKGAEDEARGHYNSIRRLQRFRWAARILDSFQDVPGYTGEMSFYSIVYLDAPCLADRADDPSWDLSARLGFSKSAIQAVRELHETTGPDGQPMVHGNLSADTILVLHDNTAALGDLGIPQARPATDPTDPNGNQQAQRSPGLIGAREREDALSGLESDIFGLHAALGQLFKHAAGTRQAAEATRVLKSWISGVSSKPMSADLGRLARSLGRVRVKSVSLPALPSRFWTEGQEVSFRGRSYRIVARLGSAGSATAFKVVELDPSTGEELRVFVAKVAHDRLSGDLIRNSHQLVRRAVGMQPGLSTVFEVATEWRADEFTALMSWVDGIPVAEFAGKLTLLARNEDTDAQDLAVRWMCSMLEAIDALHRNGLVHGGVSPQNMIVSGENLVLTDCDCVTRIGDAVTSRGAALFCSPSREVGEPASPKHDVHALAASFFQIIFDREPFPRDGDSILKGELDWDQEERKSYPALARFLDRAVDAGSGNSFASAGSALEALRAAVSTGRSTHPVATGALHSSAATDGGGLVPGGPLQTTALPSERQPNEVPWLGQLLESYPGSRRGNRETRGLDTEFARKTYVETDLEAELWSRIMGREVSLVILCGNAGDGKTALLQHLADELGIGRHKSSRRIVDQVLEDGTRVRMNLDGSAAYEGLSANQLLDGFLEPFTDGGRSGEGVHLLAVNDGRLLEWIHSEPTNTPLKESLLRLLDDPGALGDHSHIAFHHLNRSPRVGEVSLTDGEVTTKFLDRLVMGLYGGTEAAKTWEPCTTCSARERCKVYQAARVFGPDSLPDKASCDVRKQAQERLFAAFQAVHLRGETHLTVRELRSALVYILFGTRYCEDYHSDDSGGAEPPYWDRAFDPNSPRRQGEVLRELVQMDPALEAHPKVDRRLLRDAVRDSATADWKELASRRRRAYFEWTDEQIRVVARGEEPRRCLGLARGRNLMRFRDLPLLDNEQREELCQDLCRGIARIGDLPELALARKDIVPLRITPRTPTETAFWTEKPISRFRLEAESLGSIGANARPSTSPIGRELHRAAHLTYRYLDGREEKLTMSADLFHRLLRLGKGYQLADISTDDTFARLSIFLQRLVREDDREIMAWNPIRDEIAHRISIEVPGVGEDSSRTAGQVLTIRASGADEDDS
ncbi:MAG: NERD domain-containing serine/threonine-protein kinase [Bryobacterales bacterium]|nr:NERD domain-containing serine/threonine-protein kinase [Bryobacterales bacterium]